MIDLELSDRYRAYTKLHIPLNLASNFIPVFGALNQGLQLEACSERKWGIAPHESRATRVMRSKP